MFTPEIVAAFTALMVVYWQFLSDDWPVITKTKYHRTEVKEVKEIQYIKSFVFQRLGTIPVFFSLVVLFGQNEYPGPYRGVDKGLLILYQLLTGSSIAQMARFIPSSSFHVLYQSFYVKHGKNLERILDECMRTMFSNAKIRIMYAVHFNPEDFKHVTMMIDGHDSRATYINASDHAMFYSYKLKKSGFRTQVCTDINGMVPFMSKSAPCSQNNDGSMLANVDLKGKVTKYDCIVIDGGYNLLIDQIISKNTHLGKHNFVCPIRKLRSVDLKPEEAHYNNVLGSFRSAIESTFGEIGHLFERFNGKSVIRVSDIDTFTIQFKLACVLHNVKKFVRLGDVVPSEHHSYRMQPNFDYGNGSSHSVYDVNVNVKLDDKKNDAETIHKLQQQFLSMNLTNDDDEVDPEVLPDGHYEVEAIVGHAGQNVDVNTL